MTVGAKPEERQIEERARRIEHRGAVSVTQFPFVTLRGAFGGSVKWNGVYVLRRHRRLGEHRLARHSIIAVGMAVGNKALVAPIPADTLPGERVPELI